MWWKQVWWVLVMMVLVAVMPKNAGALSLACQSGVVTLVPCMAYLQGDGSGSPSFRCCGSLSSLLSSQPTCFCELLDQAGGSSNGDGINSTTALQAFSACAISLPSDIQACIAATSGGTPPGMGSSHPTLASLQRFRSKYDARVGNMMYALSCLGCSISEGVRNREL
jgi:hypothetical protein